MLDTILSILRQYGIYAWEVSDVKTKSWEFYFIRHQLDQNRVRDVEHITVKVYQLQDDGAFLGSASCEIPPTALCSEAEELINGLIFHASLVRNKPYTLRRTSVSEPLPGQNTDVSAISRDYINTMRELKETQEEYINSYEIFASSVTRRLITSEGIDVEETYPESMIEVVTNARHDGHEIEMYRNYMSGTCDAAFLQKELLRTMRFGRDRLRASATPALCKEDVLFSTDAVCEIYRYFADRMDASMIYRGISPWKIGEPVSQAGEGDLITLCTVRELPNSSQNRRVDAEGAPIRDTVLIEDGIARCFHGGRMFSSYLGLKDSFIPTNYVISGGKQTENGIRLGAYLEVVEFSDFQVDSLTGDLFGEIRLAYWYDGNKMMPVTGGSVSGSMLDFAGEMIFTEETVQYDNWRVPALTRLKGVTVTGIES